MKVKFGIGIRGSLSGGELAVRFTQASSVACAAFLLLVSADRGAMLHRGPGAVLFSLGASALPRWWLLALSLFYRKSGSEVLLAFLLLLPALAFGLAAGRLLGGGKSGAAARKAYGALLLADLLFRLLPFRFNLAFGLAFAACGFLLRLGCLVLVWLDLRADKKARLPAESGAQ